MIALWKHRILNQTSWHTKCLICGKRNRRYRYCGGDNGCVSSGATLADDFGDWTVDVNPYVPNMVRLSFSEITAGGMEQKVVYMPPDVADEFSETVYQFARWVRRNSD